MCCMIGMAGWTHHSTYSSWFLYPESLHHLEHIHHSLCLTLLNGGGYGTEHARPTNSVTAGNTHTVYPPHNPPSPLGSPAVHYNRVIAGSPLDLGHLCYDINNTSEIGTATITWPVGHVQLDYIMALPCL